jgi:hypothetical protein
MPATSTQSRLAYLGLAAVATSVVLYLSYTYLTKESPSDDGREEDEDFQQGETPMEDLAKGSHDKDRVTSLPSDDTPQPGNNEGSNKSRGTLADLIITETTSKAEDYVPWIPSASGTPIASKASLPKSRVQTLEIDGVPTDLFVQVFSDRIVLGATQLNGKFGNYLMCQAIPDEVNPKHVEYEVANLLGAREDTLLTVYARQVTERIEKLQPNPASLTVLLAISLKKDAAPSHEVFNCLVDSLVQLYLQSIRA